MGSVNNNLLYHTATLAYLHGRGEWLLSICFEISIQTLFVILLKRNTIYRFARLIFSSIKVIISLARYILLFCALSTPASFFALFSICLRDLRFAIIFPS